MLLRINAIIQQISVNFLGLQFRNIFENSDTVLKSDVTLIFFPFRLENELLILSFSTNQSDFGKPKQRQRGSLGYFFILFF